jgi:hypothetical protein
MSIPVLALCAYLSGFSLLDKEAIYKEPMAQPRTPDSSISLYTEKYGSRRIGYIEGVLGSNFPILTFEYNRLSIQTGIQAGAWLDMGYLNGAFPMLTQDFYFGFPLSFRYRAFSASLKFNHISSHLGDGMNQFLEEALSDKEKEEFELYEKIADSVGVGVTLIEPLVYSRDFLSLSLSYDLTLGDIVSRIYAHGGYGHKMHPERLERWFAGNGIEIGYLADYTAPYYSQDVTWNQDLDSIDYSGQLGVILLPHEEKYFTLRLAITAFVGYDRRGQMLGKRSKRIGLGLFIR